MILLKCGLQVLMKDIVTPVPPEEVKGVIRKCLEQAAQLNYQRIQEYAKIEGNWNHTNIISLLGYLFLLFCPEKNPVYNSTVLFNHGMYYI